jgi:hypothetical protein
MKLAPIAPAESKVPEREHRPPHATRRLEGTFLEVMREGRPKPPAAVPAPVATPGAAPSSPGRDVARFVERVGASEARVDALLEAAARGKTFKPAELIAMQVTVFRYSQTVELLSRGADKLVGAVKQTLSTQV